MENWLHGNLTVAANEKLTRFKEYAVSHPQLALFCHSRQRKSRNQGESGI
ncbi:hypothetical protein NIES3275_73590 (plasmid) [Microchaete diplosiphon NIES-3275]|nr:hypothetical protein NIES3275_73590 [Microchaete diplosiphon NIES-3275]